MTISVVQTATIGAFNNPPVTFASAVTAGNTVLLAIAAYHSGAGSITTSSPTLGGSPVTGSTAFFNPGGSNGVNSGLGTNGITSYLAIWMLPNCPGGSKTVGWTGSGQSAFVGCFALEVSGLGTAPVLDQSSSNSGTSTSAVSAGSTGSILAAPEIILAAAAIGEGYTTQPGSPWTLVSPSSNSNGGYQVATSSGSGYSWSQTAGGGGAWTAAIVTVAAALPAIPAPVYPLQRPVQARQLPRRGGHASANAGGPVQDPQITAAYGAISGAIRAAMPFSFRGRTLGGAGAQVQVSGPPLRPLAGPVRAHPALPPRGRAAASPGAPVTPPVSPAPLYASHGPVRCRIAPASLPGRAVGIVRPAAHPPGLAPLTPLRCPVAARRPLPPHGRAVTGSPGAPVRNPQAGPPVYPLHGPIGLARRAPGPFRKGSARGSQGGPVQNPDLVQPVLFSVPFARQLWTVVTARNG